MSNPYTDDLLDVVKLFNLAESKLKSTELQVFEVDIPSINELRYAGHHIVKHISGDTDDHIEKAEKHCKRAIYDAHELSVVDSLEKIRLFEKDYRISINIVKVVHGYPVKIAEVNAINQRINAVRDNGYDSRAQYYDRIERDRNRLLEIEMELSNSRNEINKLDHADEVENVRLENGRVTQRRWNIALSIIGIVAIIAEINGNGIMSWISEVASSQSEK